MKKIYSKEEKAAYFSGLRERWNEAKILAGEQKYADAIEKAHGLNVSMTGYVYTMLQMEKLGLEGIPYVDCMTYNGWKNSGFQVRRGEKSLIAGLTWVGIEPKQIESEEESKPGFTFPKEYHLFHRSQVEEIA